jgi:hypothetical protein
MVGEKNKKKNEGNFDLKLKLMERKLRNLPKNGIVTSLDSFVVCSFF